MSEEARNKAEMASHVTVREDFDRRYLLLVAVPLAVYLLFYFILAETRNAGIEFATVSLDEFAAVAFGEAKYRYFWVSAFWISSAVSVAVIVSSFLTLYRETPKKHRMFVVSLVVGFSVAITAYETALNFLLDEHWYEYMGADLYKGTLGKMPVSTEVQDVPVASYQESILYKLDIALSLGKLFAATALVTIGIGSILTLTHIVAEGGAAPEAFQERRAKHLASKVALLKAYLYQGAAVYVFAVVAMLSWMFWPVVFLEGSGTQDAYRDLVMGSAILQGVGYTVGVASLYLPPAVLLRQRVRHMAKQALVDDDSTNVDKWLRDRGLHFQPLDELRQVAVVLLPAFVSAVPTLMSI